MKFVLHEFHVHTAPIAKLIPVGARLPRPIYDIVLGDPTLTLLSLPILIVIFIRYSNKGLSPTTAEQITPHFHPLQTP